MKDKIAPPSGFSDSTRLNLVLESSEIALEKYENDDIRAQVELEKAETRTMTPEEAARLAVQVAEAEKAIAEAKVVLREAEASEAEAAAAEASILEPMHRIAPPAGLLNRRTRLNLASESDDTQALVKAEVDLELAKMTMTPEEIARAAVQAVGEAEIDVVKSEAVVSEAKLVEAFILNRPIMAHLGVKREGNFVTTAEPMKESSNWALAKYEPDDTQALVKAEVDLELAKVRSMTPDEVIRSLDQTIAEAKIVLGQTERVISEAKAEESFILNPPIRAHLGVKREMNFVTTAEPMKESSNWALAKYEPDDTQALVKAEVDLELAKVRSMTPDEVIRTLDQTIAEAKIVLGQTERVISEAKAEDSFILNPPIRAHLSVKREMNFVTTAEPVKGSCNLALAKYANDDTRALVKAQVDLELDKMRSMTAKDAARVAIQEAAGREAEAVKTFSLGVKREMDFVTTAEPTKKKK